MLRYLWGLPAVKCKEIFVHTKNCIFFVLLYVENHVTFELGENAFRSPLKICYYIWKILRNLQRTGFTLGILWMLEQLFSYPENCFLLSGERFSALQLENSC